MCSSFDPLMISLLSVHMVLSSYVYVCFSFLPCASFYFILVGHILMISAIILKKRKFFSKYS